MTATLNFMDIVLKTEYEFYQKIKAQLLAEGREGKFVLIKDNSIIGFFEDAKEAYEAGVKKFGTGLFLVQKVLKEEPVETIQQFHVPLH